MHSFESYWQRVRRRLRLHERSTAALELRETQLRNELYLAFAAGVDAGAARVRQLYEVRAAERTSFEAVFGEQ